MSDDLRRQPPLRAPVRLCVLTTIGKSIQVLYAGRLEFLASAGFEVTAVCASSEDDAAIRARGVALTTVPFTRAVTPLTDIVALFRLYRILRAGRFDLVEVSTPKAAMIGALAARLAGCRVVIHVLHGLAYEGKRGLLGLVIRTATWIPSRLAHVTYAVSPSARQRLCDDGLVAPDRVRVLGAGSINGVNLQRFSPALAALGPELRAQQRIPGTTVVIGFIGRLVRDKGIHELAMAFAKLHEEYPETALLLVGDYEHRDRPSDEVVRILDKHGAIHRVGWRDDVRPFLGAMDILCLPTYREGLPGVVLEAAAVGIPTVTTDATGARDTVIDGETGVRVPMADTDALREGLARLVRDRALRERMGAAARTWVEQAFDQQVVWQRQERDYRTLAANGPQGSPMQTPVDTPRP